MEEENRPSHFKVDDYKAVDASATIYCIKKGVTSIPRWGEERNKVICNFCG
jgi:hypothetical protein